MRLLVQGAPRELDLTEKKYQVKAAQEIWVFLEAVREETCPIQKRYQGTGLGHRCQGWMGNHSGKMSMGEGQGTPKGESRFGLERGTISTKRAIWRRRREVWART